MPDAHRRRIATAEESTKSDTHRGNSQFKMMSILDINFVQVGNGRIALYHRPKNTDFPLLRETGCTHIVTLLKESEGAEKYGALAKEAGLEWFWLSVPNGKYPQGEIHERLISAMPTLSKLLDGGKSLIIHCSAGIHRTGMVAYGLLRWHGIDSAKAMTLIHKMRRETAEGMMEKRRQWGDDNTREPHIQETPWINSVKEFVNHLRTKLFKSR
jgi:protein-tyrosine phosphatase